MWWEDPGPSHTLQARRRTAVRRSGMARILGRREARAMPLPRSLAHLKREISKKKWANGLEVGPQKEAGRHGCG